MRSTLGIAVAIGLGLAASSGAGIARAENPNRSEITDFFVLFPDTDQGVSVFINISARDFCDWDQASPPPVQDVVVSQGKMTGQGALVTRVKESDLYVEMWEFDEDPSPLIGPCEDIADQLNDPAAQPFAVGSTSYQGNDNDLMGSGTRGNAFGDRGDAVLTSQDDTVYDYSWRFHLNSRCNWDMGAPPCLIESSSLEAR
jgi:predicted RNA-binding protein with TRAM domain